MLIVSRFSPVIQSQGANILNTIPMAIQKKMIATESIYKESKDKINYKKFRHFLLSFINVQNPDMDINS